MKGKKTSTIAGFLAIISTLVFAACGEDSSVEVSSDQRDSGYDDELSSSSAKRTSVQTTFELGSCSYANENERLYVTDEDDYFTCSYSYADGFYTWKNSKKINSSSSYGQDCITVFANNGYEVVCVGDVTSSGSSPSSSSSVTHYTNVSDVWNGKMEKPVTDYIDGRNYMLIYTAEELAYFADQVTNKGETGLNAKLMQHIRLNPDNMVDENGNLLLSQSSLNEWTPIGGGTSSITYNGVFDGNGYVVSGIYVNKPAFERAGFIGTLGGTSASDSGHVLFLGIENSYVVGGDQVGGIVGRMNRAEVQQVFNRKSYVKGAEYVGGIVGYKNSGWLYYAYNSGMVVSSGNRASGIVGYNDNASTSIIVSYNVGFLIAPNEGRTAGVSTSTNSSKDCFYLDQSDRDIESNGAEQKSEYFMQGSDFVSTLNGLSYKNIWQLDNGNVNDGFPVFTWVRIILK